MSFGFGVASRGKTQIMYQAYLGYKLLIRYMFRVACLGLGVTVGVVLRINVRLESVFISSIVECACARGRLEKWSLS